MSGHRLGQRIFVIENEEAVRELSVRILTRAGYRVTAVGDGLDAWRIFEADPGAFDLLFVDVRIPRLGGEKFGHLVRALRPQMPILFTSGLNFEQLHPEWALMASIAFLAKPYKPETLLIQVRLMLGEKLETASEQ